jgi:hypothetical protein
MCISKAEMSLPAVNSTLPETADILSSGSAAQPIWSQVKSPIPGHYLESAWLSGASYPASSR